MTLTLIQSHSCMRSQKLRCSFLSQNSLLIWMKFRMLSQPKLVLNLFYSRIILRGELCWCDFMKYVFNIVLCQDTCEPIHFKLGMMLKTTKLNSLIPVWMSFMFTEGHWVTGKLELVQSFCCKLQEATQMFIMQGLTFIWTVIRQMSWTTQIQ